MTSTKKSKKPVNDNTEESPEFTEFEDNLPATFHDAAIQWVDTIRSPEESFNTTLYKYDGKIGDKKSLCGQWVDEIPNGHNIGLTYGSGRFRLYVTFAKSESRDKHTIKSYMFHINEHYDKLREDGVNNKDIPGVVQGSSFGQAQNLDSAFVMFQKIFALLLPLIVANKGGDQNQFPGFSDMMVDHYKSLNDVMKNNFIEQQKLYGRILDSEVEPDDTIPAEPESGGFNQLIQTIIPLVEQFFPQLSGSDPNSVAIQEAIKNSPQFQQLTKNKIDFGKLLKFLTEKYGKKEVSKILKNLGILTK